MSKVSKTFLANLEPIDFKILERVAYIVGGGASLAMDEYRRLQKKGKNPSMWLDRKNSTWVVQHDNPSKGCVTDDK